MSRVTWNADLIADLRRLVIDHNARGVGETVKLAQLKKTYESGYSGLNPGLRAMEKVDTVLRKAAGDFDAKHPRGTGGKFSDKGSASSAPKAPASPHVSIDLPASEEEHRALQATNAGYRALTSQALPTNKHEFEGAQLRHIGAAAGAGLIVAGLLRGKANGLVQRSVESTLGAAGRLVVGAPVGAAARLGETAVHAVARGVRMTSAEHPSFNAANRIWDAAGSAGNVAGRATGRVLVGGAGSLARGTVRMAGRRGGLRGKVAQGAAVAGMAVPLAAAIDDRTRDTPLDPQAYGRAADAFSSRIVEKVVASEELGKLAHQMTAAIEAGGMEALAKLNIRSIPGITTNIGRALRTVGGAIAGGAVGAGAGALTQHLAQHARGNPYRDAEGRFTSKDNAVGGHTGAVVGAAIGAGAAAGGIYLALRNHNSAALDSSLKTLGAKLTSYEAKIASPEGYGPKLRALIRNRQADINEGIRNDTAHAKAISNLDRFGASHEDHYKTAMRDEVNNRLGAFLQHHDAFEIPARMVDQKTLARLGDSPDSIAVRRLRMTFGPHTIASAVAEFADTATDAEFDKAIAKLPEAAREDALKLFRGRAGLVDSVKQHLDAHHQAIEASETKLKGLADHAEGLESAAQQMGAKLELEPEETLADAKKAAKAAEAEATKARAAHQKALMAHQKLVATPPAVPGPTGTPLEKPSDGLQRHTRGKLVDAVTAKHTKIVDKKIEALRARLTAGVRQKHNKLLAAKISLGLENGATVPEHLRPHAQAVVDTHRTLQDTAGKLRLAERAHKDAKDTLKKLKALAATEPRMPRDAMDYDADELFDQIQSAKSALSDATRREADLERAHRSAKLDHHLAEAHANEAEHAFVAALHGTKTAAIGTNLPSKLVSDLRYEWDRARQTVGSPLHAFVNGVTPKALGQFAESAKEHAASAGAFVARHARNTADELFYRPDDTGARVLSIPRVATVGVTASVTGLAAAGAAAEHYTNAKDYIFGSEEKRKNARPFTPKGGFKVAHDRDALTGEGFVALHVPNKSGDGTVIWAQRTHANSDKVSTIYAGGKLSSLKQRLAEVRQQRAQQNTSGGGAGGSGTPGARQLNDIPNFPADKVNAAINRLANDKKLETISGPGGEMQFRAKDGDDQGTASQFIGGFRQKFLQKKDGWADGFYHTALDALLSRQGRVLTTGQAYGLLTGYSPAGESKGNSIFKPANGFKSSDADDVVEALNGEVDRVNSSFAPRGDRNKGALHIAAELVGKVKGLTKEQLAPIHTKIDTGGAASSSAPKVTQLGPDAPLKPTRADPAAPIDMPAGWDAEKLKRLAAASQKLSHRLNVDPERLSDVISHFAMRVGHSHGLDEAAAVGAAYETLVSVTGDTGNRAMARESLVNADHEHFFNILDGEADKQLAAKKRLGKAILLDDFDAMLKSFEAGGGGGLGSRVLRESVGDAAEAGVKSEVAGAQQSRRPSSWYSPSRIGVEGGSLFASELAGRAAAAIIPGAGFAEEAGQAAANGAFGSKVASFVNRLTGGAPLASRAGLAAAAGTAGRAALHHGGSAVAGSAGYLGAGAALRATSSKYQGGGYQGHEQLAESAGQLVGAAAASHFQGAVGRGVASAASRVGSAFLGRGLAAEGAEAGAELGAAAGPVGLVGGAALGAAGAYAGGVVARGAYDLATSKPAEQLYSNVSKWFAPYGQQGAKALSRMQQHGAARPGAPR